MNIDTELEKARDSAYEAAKAAKAARIVVRSAAWAAAECSEILTRSAAWVVGSAVDSSKSYNKERLKQLKMIKDIL